MTCDHIWIEGAEGAFAGLTHHCPKCGEETTRPPDRGSIDTWYGRPIDIWLDDVKQRKVVAYDTIMGTVTRIALDEEGAYKFVLDSNGEDGSFVHETVTGVVRVEWIE